MIRIAPISADEVIELTFWCVASAPHRIVIRCGIVADRFTPITPAEQQQQQHQKEI